MFTADEVAGIVDLFGALPPERARTALSELAYRRGGEPPEGAVDDACSAFVLVSVERDGERLVVPGPAAFPTLPDGAEDLPHILDAERRSVDREAVERAAVSRLRAEAACAATLGDDDRAAALVEISYDIEAWGGRELGGVRALLGAEG